jgi:hypothetical protein
VTKIATPDGHLATSDIHKYNHDRKITQGQAAGETNRLLTLLADRN